VTIVCIASGPSLTRDDVALVERAGHPILGINNAYQVCDKLTYHYACDQSWWHRHYPYTQARTRKFCTEERTNAPAPSEVEQMKRGHTECFSHKWPILCTGKNGGFQALNLAYLLGYGRIILLGYDMQGTSGSLHWHEDHAFQGAKNPKEGTFKEWRRIFNKMASEILSVVEVLNATRQTALECFPKIKLEEVL